MGQKITHGGIFPVPPQQQPYRYGRREGGRFCVVSYETPSQSQVDALAVQADTAGYNYEVILSHGKARLEIEYNYNNVVGGYSGRATEAEETWEIIPSKALKDLLDSVNPLVLACTQGELTDMKKRKLNNTLQSSAYYDVATGLLVRQTYGTANTPYSDVGMKLYKALLDGVDQVEVVFPVLTHSKVVTAVYVSPAQFANVGRIISTATLISSEGIPGTVLFDFPSNVDPSPIPIGSTGVFQSFLYGWIKDAPSVRQVSKKKWNITNTWSYGLWLMDLYGGTRL